MNFDYNHLKNITLYLPFITLLFGIFAIAFSIFKTLKPNFNFNPVSTILFIVGLFFIITSISQLRYGYKLLYDNPNETTTITGDVVNISDLNIGLKYYYKGVAVSPKIVEISGEEYYFMTVGDIEVNDIITVTYLNNSKFVLIVEMEVQG